MTIGFFHVDRQDEAADQGYRCASMMIQSARAVMPFVPIVHFTDQTSKTLKHVSAVVRKPSEPMGLLRMRHCASVKDNWLFVDTDIIFQQPVDNVFKRAFDIAVTTRDWAHIKQAVGFTERMPFNTGVVFSRCPSFWAEIYTRLRHLDPDLQDFMGEQQLICEVALDDARPYHIKKLSGTVYNFPPEIPGIPSAAKMQKHAYIVHYKGEKRKALMLGAQCA